MNNEVKLYINNQEVEFQQSPDILFTYQEDDLTNPTVVKNSYTKTIKIPGTKKNNAIFDGIWNLERVQTEENFNVTKRVPFTIYINSEAYQTGYAKLDNISKSNNKIEYSITLYGGLGQFLYNLSIDWNTGEKKTLADMDYYQFFGDSTPLDLGFVINKDTVATAWDEINNNGKWSVVNFSPTYIGYPDKINCNKVLINFNNAPVISSAVTSGETTYTSTGGYALGNLPQNLTSEEVRDYRSYIQTPVIRVKSIFEAICDRRNNAGRYDDGYDIDVDTDFFNADNPYYNNAWMTLPTITNLEFTNDTSGGTSTAYTHSYSSAYVDALGNCVYTFPLDSVVTGSNITMKATIDLGVTGSSTSQNLYFYHTKIKGRASRVYYRNAYGIQLYASNSNNLNENVLAGSNVKWVTGQEKYTYADAVASGQFSPKWATNVVENHIGYFTKVSGNTYQYTGETGNLLELTCDLPVGTSYFKLYIKRCNSSNDSNRNKLFTSVQPNSGSSVNVDPMPFYSSTIDITSIDSGSSLSNKYIDKEMLLSTSFSPADWLLSYCKKFGLYMKKDKIENKIYIMTRNKYFKRNNVIDIDNDIDYSKSFSINPVYCQNGYLSLTDEAVVSKTYSDYTKKTGKEYGQKIVNTGYEFNADTKELNDKGIFKNAVQTKDISQYYANRSYDGLLPYMYDNVSYNLYENGNYSGSTLEVDIPQDEINKVCTPYSEIYPNYDLVSKPMFANEDNKPLDTESVLLFFNGYENITYMKWYLTDDLTYMYRLNNAPCWLMTFSEYDSYGNKIANEINQFPRFSRWLEGNRWMIYSFDYGSPRYLYVPEMVNNDEGNVYSNYYKKYYEDLYDIDTKVVDCYVKGKFDEESLRSFYWFRNSLWRLNKITDYNPVNHDTTKVQFVKVQDLSNMTNEVATSELSVTVELDRYELPASGGTIKGYVKTSDNYGWNIENITITPEDEDYILSVEPTSRGSSGSFTITASPNYDSFKEIEINITAGDVGTQATFTQEVGERPYLRVVPDTIEFTSTGGTATFAVQTNVNWNSYLISNTYAGKYLTFNIISGGKLIWKLVNPTYAHGDSMQQYLYYSRDDGENWERVLSSPDGTAILVNTGDKIVVKHDGDINDGTNYDGAAYNTFSGSTAVFELEGNISSICNGTHFRTGNYLGNFYRLFAGCQGLVSAENLYMENKNFAGVNVASGSDYTEMFRNCTNLTTAPTSIYGRCNGMFIGCTSLYYAPALTMKYLNNGIENNYYYANMFSGCTSLTTAPELIATSLSNFCYQGMFAGCTNLVSVPNLPANILSQGCYEKMFSGCTSLVNAPELPALELTEDCYNKMFYGCSSLRNIKCYATDITSAVGCTTSWVSGVGGTGTFTKNSSMEGWVIGPNGIPNGWTIQNKI